MCWVSWLDAEALILKAGTGRLLLPDAETPKQLANGTPDEDQDRPNLSALPVFLWTTLL
jgi:hypothetical protein